MRIEVPPRFAPPVFGDVSFDEDTMFIVNELRRAVYMRLKKARRHPNAHVTVRGFTPSMYTKVFTELERANLFRRRPSKKMGEFEFWSPYPEAGDVLVALHDMFNPIDSTDGDSHVRREAGGSWRVRPRGDLVGISPPFRVENKQQTVGPAKAVKTWTVKFYFTISVISAGATQSKIIHPKFPSFDDDTRWPQVPYFKDPSLHYQIHLKKIIHKFNLNQEAMGVNAILTEVQDIDDEEPTNMFKARPKDDRRRQGMMWSEEKAKWIEVKNSKRMKMDVVVSNQMFRVSRYHAWHDRRRLRKKELQRQQEQARRDKKEEERRQREGSMTRSDYDFFMEHGYTQVINGYTIGPDGRPTKSSSDDGEASSLHRRESETPP